MKKITVNFSDLEYEKIEKARELSGLRTKAELIRFLLTQYIREYYK